ncbi:MAG TPA: type 4a pilus biogenesis protein PilO [Planctomycetota bacterium]|nr:type 4a pilus biogenesis protein PilO [Planctomycetota bacterium]
MASWTQKKQLIAIGGGAIVLCLSAVGGVYYTQGLIEDVQVQTTQKQEAIVTAEGKIAQIPGAEREVVILRENLDEYVKILPDTKELNAFVRTLNQFERQSGIMGTGLTTKNSRIGKASGQFTPIEYTYDFTATLWQFLKFINLLENYERFVSITDFSIQSGASSRGESSRDGDVVHKVRLTMQTYTYNGKATGKEVEIPEYASLKESLREEIWKRMQTIRIDRYEHKGHGGRRDILIDPRERGDQHNDGPSPAEQRGLLERYIGEISRLKEMMVRMRRQDTTLFEQYALEKGLKEGLEKLGSDIESDHTRVSYAPYRLRWAKEVVAPLDDLRGQMDSAAKAETRRVDPFLPEKDMQQLVSDMEADCRSGQLESAKNRYEIVASRLGVPPEDPRHALAVAAKSWHVKASTALDFKGMDLRVQGLVVNRNGRSGVLLNGEVYEEGDYISDELLIKLVEEEQVWFVFRGLTLVRTM